MEKQRSSEWFEKRKGRVTGSNVGAVLGMNPYKTADDVLREMVRAYHGAKREFTGNAATEWGSFNEEGATAEFEMEHGLKVEECGFFVHPKHDWLGASPDGLVDDDAVAEIKCPYGQRKKSPPEFKSVEDQEHYFAQMQIEMYCSGRSRCYFYQWGPHGSQLDVVLFDQEWIDTNLPALEAFHSRYLSELDNPEHLEPKRKIINSNMAEKLITEYEELTEAADRAAQRKKEILDTLILLAGEKNADICGKKLTQVERKGSVSYAKAIKELAPGADLTKWTGKPTTYWKLS